MITDFSPNKFVKERLTGNTYKVLSWQRDSGNNIIVMIRWDYFGTGDRQSLSFTDDRLAYYSEYYFNTKKPRIWYGPAGHRTLIDGIAKPICYFFLDRLFKR